MVGNCHGFQFLCFLLALYLGLPMFVNVSRKQLIFFPDFSCEMLKHMGRLGYEASFCNWHQSTKITLKIVHLYVQVIAKALTSTKINRRRTLIHEN